MEPVAFAALVKLDPADDAPLATRIYRALAAAIRAGRLPVGTRLPSTRAAAVALGVARNTTSAAYDLLRAEGVVSIRTGAAPVVLDVAADEVRPPSPAAAPGLSARGATLAIDPRRDLHAAAGGALAPGSPDEALFPRETWARTLRRVGRARHGPAAGYGAYWALPQLAAALAERLRADRGVDVDPERVIVTPGTQASLALVAATLADPGERALVEHPGYAGARAAFLAAGLELVPLPVDAAGADIAAADAQDARLAYVTPSNQHPTAVRLPLGRRQALVDWARTAGAVLVEDDYDSEFHWRGRAIGALQPLAPECVVYLGSAAKSLAPGLRLGWMAVPGPLAGPLRAAHRSLGLGANIHAQAALADLMAGGAWRAHQRQLARAYEARGRALADALEERLGPRVEVHRPDGGLHLALHLADAPAEHAAIEAAGRAGFGIAALSRYGCGAPAPPGLVIGFADADASRIARLVDLLDRALPG